MKFSSHFSNSFLKVFSLFLVIFFSCFTHESLFADTKSAPEQKKNDSTDLDKKAHSNRYFFAFRFLTNAICNRENYELFTQNLDSKKMNHIWNKIIEKRCPEILDEGKDFVVEKLDIGKESWLIKFPTPKDSPLPSLAIIYSEDAATGRYFTLEKMLNLDNSSNKNIAFVCECKLDADDKFAHDNFTISLELDDKTGFIEAVKSIIKDSTRPPVYSTHK